MIARFFLAAAVLWGSSGARWSWYPVNTTEQSGIKFYFEQPCSGTVRVHIFANDGDQPINIEESLSTDTEHGGGFLPIRLTHGVDSLQVERMDITGGNWTQTVNQPKAGTHYPMCGSRGGE